MLEKFINFSNPVQLGSEKFLSSEFDLPDEILFLLKEYPNNSFFNGFLFTVNPNVYKELLESIYMPYKYPLCFARDAFGNLYIWEDNSIVLVNIVHGTSEIIGKKLNVFFNLKMTDITFLKKRLSFDLYREVSSKLGLLNFDECFAYVPLLALGGAEKLENLQRVKIREHIHLISQMVGKIE